MEKKWHNILFSNTDEDKNLMETTGALIIIISFVLPWFKKIYLLSKSYIYGVQFLSSSWGNNSLFPSGLIIIFLTALPFLVLIMNKRKLSIFLSFLGIILLSLLLYKSHAPLESYYAGPAITYLGMLIILLSIFKKRQSARGKQ